MEIKGIDVSSYQGKPDWEKVSAAGIKFAILRVHQKNGIDSSFEHNYKGCKQNGIPIGVYKFSYALTEAQALEEAEDVIGVLNGRGLDFPVFYDLEWASQKILGKAKITKIVKKFMTRIQKAGYKAGIYCNMDWYKNVLDTKALDYDYWIARYPSNDTGEIQERLRVSSDIAVGWQYSSKGKVSGISGNVDMDIFYTDYSAGEATKEETKIVSAGTFKTENEAINALIGVAEDEIGYLEKKSNSNLDSKTANAGSANYTKYWRDLYPSYQGQPWCAIFISWIFYITFGLDMAKKLLKHWPYVYCPTLGTLFTKHANPQKGDIVIFYHNGTFTHTGLVTKVSGDKFWTIEGNTSGASGIIANGGGVCEKSYYNSKLPGTKFCRPDYGLVVGTVTNTTTATGSSSGTLNKTPKWVGKVTASTLNVRTWAGTANPQIKSYPTLKEGNLVDVCDSVKASDGSTWYYIRIAGKYYGFVSAKYIQKQ